MDATNRPDAVNWTNEPPDETATNGWPLRRIPPQGLANVIILSHDLWGTGTHYWGGRTVPCHDDRCDACDAHNESRWHGYLCAWAPKTHYKFLLELTKAGAAAVIDERKKRHTIRGLILAAERLGRKANGKLVLHLTPSDWADDGLPPAVDVRSVMLKIWGIREDQAEQDLHKAFQQRSKALRSNGQVV